MKIKDIIGISLISLVVFPVVLLVMALSMNVVRLEYGMSDEAKTKANTYLRKYRPIQDEAEVAHMKTYKALQKKEKEIAQERMELNREYERLEELKIENKQLKDKVTEDRKAMEKLVGKTAELKLKQIQALAEVYGSMRPEEAAPILLTLSDKEVAEIIKYIPEVRAQSKIMGVLGIMNVQRAASISQLLKNS